MGSTVDSVEVWSVDTRAPAAVQARCAAVLDREQRSRADGLGCPAARRRFVVAHGAARLLLADRLAVPPRELRWRRGEHGKPFLIAPTDSVQCNLSHSGDLAMLAVTGHRPVGVDLQQPVDPQLAVRLAGRFFPAAEAALVRHAVDPAAVFGRLWTRKEACAKAAGGRLLPYLAWSVAGAGDPVVVRAPAGRTVDGSAGGPVDTGEPGGGPAYLVRDLPMVEGWNASVALAGTRPYALVHYTWPVAGG